MRFKLSSILLLTPLLFLTNLKAANQAAWAPIAKPGPNGSLIPYESLWGPANPQFVSKTGVGSLPGFASWVFDQWNPPTQSPEQPPFFIDTTRHAWGINVPADIDGQPGYDAAWISFTGAPSCLTVNQLFITGVLFTVPGPYYGGSYGTVDTPTEGVDFFAQSSQQPSAYDSFGHQVIGVYLGPSPSGPAFTLVVHPTVSDENPPVVVPIPQLTKLISAANTAQNPLEVGFFFVQGAAEQWSLLISSRNPNGTPLFLTLNSQQYGLTWNKLASEGLDAVRYFCSQGGATPGGPLKIEAVSVQ